MDLNPMFRTLRSQSGDDSSSESDAEEQGAEEVSSLQSKITSKNTETGTRLNRERRSKGSSKGGSSRGSSRGKSGKEAQFVVDALLAAVTQYDAKKLKKASRVVRGQLAFAVRIWAAAGHAQKKVGLWDIWSAHPSLA